MLEPELFALLEQTADAAYTVTDGGEICSWNGAAERLFGYPASEVLRRNIDEVLEASLGRNGRRDPEFRLAGTHPVCGPDLGERLDDRLR